MVLNIFCIMSTLKHMSLQHFLNYIFRIILNTDT